MRAPSRRRNADEPKQPTAEPADRGHPAADRSAHQRYHAMISRAVTEHGETTFSFRETLYERARAAQTAALHKYDPPLTKTDFDREHLALEQAIDRVEQAIASELANAARPQKRGFLTPYGVQISTSDRFASFRSNIGRGLYVLFALVVVALSSLEPKTVVSYLAWPLDVITEAANPSGLQTYRVVYSDGVAQKMRLFPDEVERWIRVSNIANAPKHYQIVRVIDPQGRVVWGQ